MNQIPGHLFASDPTCRELPDGRFWIFATHDQCSSEFQAPADYWDNMYFGTTPSACSVSLEMLFLPGDIPQGSLEIRLDRLEGPLLGSLELPAYRDEESVLWTPPVSGCHALYFHFTGSAEPGTHPACRLLAFRISGESS